MHIENMPPTLRHHEDEFVPYIDKVITVFVINYSRPVTGRLIGMDEDFLRLEHRDGRVSMIRRSAITFLAEVPKK